MSFFKRYIDILVLGFVYLDVEVLERNMKVVLSWFRCDYVVVGKFLKGFGGWGGIGVGWFVGDFEY